MITAEQVVAVRQREGLSRRALAELTGLTVGKIWRIEMKGIMSTEEVEVLQTWITSYPGQSPPTSEPTQTVPFDTRFSPVTTPVETADIDWDKLRGVADRVDEHELERAETFYGPNPDDRHRLISNSELQTFKACRRKWWLGWYRGLTLKKENPLGPLAIGGRIHRALKAFYVPEGQVPIDPREALETIIQEDWRRITRAYMGQPDGGQGLVQLAPSYQSEADLERAMIEGYMEWLADTGVDADYEVVASEQYVEATIINDDDVTDESADVLRPTKLIGKLDVRVRRTTDGRRLFIDHKTTASFTSLTAMLPLDEQMLHYHLLEWLNTAEGEARCDGALYNMLRKVKRTAAAKPPFFDRVEVRHNVYELESYKHRVLGTVLDLLGVEADLRRIEEGRDTVPVHSIVYPRPSSDCTWKCDFFPVCSMFDDGSRAEDMLTQLYDHHDPLDYYRDPDQTEGAQ
jgi:hypothetical protein